MAPRNQMWGRINSQGPRGLTGKGGKRWISLRRRGDRRWYEINPRKSLIRYGVRVNLLQEDTSAIGGREGGSDERKKSALSKKKNANGAVTNIKILESTCCAQRKGRATQGTKKRQLALKN